MDSDDDALRLMNDSPFGLTASLWTADLDRAQRVGDTIYLALIGIVHGEGNPRFTQGGRIIFLEIFEDPGSA